MIWTKDVNVYYLDSISPPPYWASNIIILYFDHMLIWITGTISAGKWTIVDYLIEYGFAHYSVRNYLAAILQEQWLPIIRDNTTPLANWLREKYGGSYIVEQLIEQSKRDQQELIVIESIRAIDEANLIKQNWWILLWITADQELRYQRALGRNSSTDHITFEKFIDDEYIEGSSMDQSKSNVFTCLELADIVFLNNGTLEELYLQLDTYFDSLNLTR